MTTREKISALESRQHELRATMADSDAHASRCQKLGLNFSETYPDELETYQNANNEWHDNEVQIAELYEELKREEEEERRQHEPDGEEA